MGEKSKSRTYIRFARTRARDKKDNTGNEFPHRIATKPLCEVCGKKPPISISYFGDRSNSYLRGWLLCCLCTSAVEDYYIEFSLWNEEWLPHLRQKIWFNEGDFFDCIERARKGGFIDHELNQAAKS